MKLRTKQYVIIFSILLLVLILASLCIGRYPIALRDILSLFVNATDQMDKMVFYNIRLPRTLMVTCAGFSLAYVGSIMQTIFKNPLASPDIIGVSSGAGAGVAIAIVVFGSGIYLTMISAFLGGLVAVMLGMVFVKVSNQRHLASFVLSGIAVNAVAQSLIMFMKMSADPEQQLASIEFWLMGGFNNVTSSNAYYCLPVIIICLVILCMMHRQVSVLSLSDDDAMALGVNLKRIRPILLILSTMIVASTVCVSGLINFIGLIAPHLARLLLKRNNAYTWLTSGLMGSCLLLISDLIARSIMTSEIPISIVTSLFGAPILIVFMIRKEKVI